MTDDIRAKLVQALDEKRLIACRFPGGGDMTIALERHMVDQAIEAWRTRYTTPGERRKALDSVRGAIKRTAKRMKQNRACGNEIDAMAADIALWLGHELLFADGERYLIKGPSREDLLGKPH